MRFLLLLLGLCASFRAGAEIQVNGLQLDPGSGVDIKITSVFKQLPPAGFATLQILIRNNSGRSREWSFQFNSGANLDSFRSSRAFAVENGEEKNFEVLVPLATNENRTYANNNVQIGASGYGITRGAASLFSSAGSGQTLTDFTLISSALALHSWGPLENACKKAGNTLHGSEFNPNVLPADWRGYIGAGSMWIADTEWQGLDVAPRNAIREWVMQGGKLVICSTAAHPVSDFGFMESNPGYGTVRTLEWNGKELNENAVRPEIIPRNHSLVEHLTEGYKVKWELPGAISNLPLNAGFIIGFVTCFAVVIGPLNLFWFAKNGKRHRLFFTTPLISLAGSALLAGVIVLQDGFGGNGNRFIAIHLLPDEKEALVTQEQFARTGLLISPHFRAEDKIYIGPINNLATPATNSRGAHSRSNHHYSQQDSSYSGDWFASRSLQAQFIQVTRPTRARVEVVSSAAGAPPVLLSSVENNLKQVFYIDADGKYWQTSQLRVGEKKIMQLSSEAAFNQWWTGALHNAGDRIRDLATRTKARRGYFYAVAEEVKGEAVPTLTAIRWSNQTAVYLGACREARELVKQ